MNRKILKLGLASLMVLLAVSMTPTVYQTAALNVNADEDVVVHAMPYDFGEYSIFHARSYATAQWQAAVYGYLVKRMASHNKDYGPDLAAASPTVSADKLTFTFTLRDDLKFASGAELTTSDIEFSFHATLTPEINQFGGLGAYIGFMDNDSITVIDEKTVSFTLLQTYAFPYGLLAFPVLDEDYFSERYDNCVAGVLEDCVWNAPDGSDIGSAGPFMVDNIDGTNNIVTLVANPNYWNAEEVFADKLIFQYIAEPDAAISALASGEIDILDAQYIPGVDDLKDLDGVREEYLGGPVTQLIVTNNLHPMFGDGSGTPAGLDAACDEFCDWDAGIAVRHAMSYIVNRQFAVDELLEGLGLPAATDMPAASLGWDSSLQAHPYDIDLAKGFMEDAGFNYADLGTPDANGKYANSFFDLSIISPNTNPARNQWAAGWEQELPKIGIGVTTHDSVDWDTLYPRTFLWGEETLVPLYDDGGYDVFFVGYVFDLDFQPLGGWDKSGRFDTGDGNNVNNWDVDEKYSDLGDIARAYTGELDFETRIGLVEDWQAEFYAQLPDIPIVYPQDHWGFDEGLTGFDTLLMTTGNTEWELVTNTDFTKNTKKSEDEGLPINSFAIVSALLASVFVTTYRKRNFN